MTFQTYGNLIIEEAKRQGVNPALALAIAEQESSFNPKAKSNKGAVGLFQLMPSAAIDMKIKPSERWDPKKNIKAGVGYIKKVIDDADGNVEEALARYNFGGGNVDAGKPLPEETINFKARILNERLPKYAQYASAEPQTMTDASPIPSFEDFVKNEYQPSNIPSFEDFVKNEYQATQQASQAAQQLPEGNILTGIAEPLMTIGSGLAGQAAGGYAGMAAGGLYDRQTASNVAQGVAQDLTYQPRTQAGQRGLENIGKGIEALETGLQAPAAGLTGIGATVSSLFEGKPLQDALQAGATRTREFIDRGYSGELGRLAEPLGPEAATVAYMAPSVALSAAPYLKAAQTAKAAPVAEKALSLKETAQAQKFAGRVAQGKESDIAKQIQVSKELTEPEIKSIKTYGEYSNVLKDKIKNASRIQDEILDRKTDTFRLAQLNRGPAEAQINYAKIAMDQLKDYYKSTKDVDGALRISKLKQKAIGDGLTVKELNNIAREHNTKLSKFNASGELPSGASAQEIENIRAGLKGTVRELVDDPQFLDLDSSMSNMYAIKTLSDKNAKAAQKVIQKIQDRGIFEKGAAAITTVADTLTGKIVSGSIARLFPKGQGVKLNTAMDMQSNLQSNLMKIDDILNRKGMSKADKRAAIESIAYQIAITNEQLLQPNEVTVKITKFKEDQQ